MMCLEYGRGSFSNALFIMINPVDSLIVKRECGLMNRATDTPSMNTTLEVTPLANKRIIVPFDEATYEDLLLNRQAYHAFLTEQIQARPELFPATIQDGWSFYGLTAPSTKQGLRLRRIQTKTDGAVWHIHPSFMMPYMTCDTATAEQILFLAKGVPDWALARVFQKDVMTISRLRTSLGR
jgi:hypothetical protein